MHNQNKQALGVLLLLVLLAAAFFFYRSKEPEQMPTEIPSEETAASFHFPATLPTKYISTVDWPPQTKTIESPFTSCTPAGIETERAGETKEVVINNRTFCVTKVSDGAAGSMYTQYAYVIGEKDKTLATTFSLRFVQCGNYNEPEKKACEQERAKFDIDALMSQWYY